MSSGTATAAGTLDTLGVRLVRGRDRLLALRPAAVLAPLVFAQWAAVGAFVLTVRHNGWLFYQGGDQLFHYSDAWLLAHGTLPPTFVGYAWSIFLLPVVPLAGANLLGGLPAIILLNTLVLLPLALFGVYAIGERIAGRLFGYLAATLWIVVPFAGILLVNEGYHAKYTELTLPQLLGLTAMADFPSMVALIVSAALTLRALDTGGWLSAGMAGLAAGTSIAIKPSGAVYLVAPAIALLVFRWRALGPFAIGLAPAVFTLALWKYRGFGHLPAFAAPPPHRVALGAGDVLDPVHRYTKLNSWQHLRDNLLGLQEHFWASRVLEWLPIAGTIGLIVRSRRGMVLVGGWFALFLLLKGSYSEARMDDASFFRVLMPGFPAYVLLIAAIALLVPGVRARTALPRTFPWRGRRLAVLLAAVGIVFAAIPLGVVAAATPLRGHGERALEIDPTLVPVSKGIGLQASEANGSVRLSWRRQSPAGGKVFYRVLRTNAADGGISCETGLDAPPAYDCRLTSDVVAPTRSTSYLEQPGPGRWTYRIGVTANWLNDFRYGDVYVLSRSVTVTVR